MMYCQRRVAIADASGIGEARREASRLASVAQLDAEHTGKVSIVASELATNLARYASGGEILLRNYDVGSSKGLEILSIDRGPGLTNISRCLEDGYSTGGTAGQGLGAVRRLSTEFDIFSAKPAGTVVLARVTQEKPRHCSFPWGVVNRPYADGDICGDTWRIAAHSGSVTLMVADGLGHGPLAAEAADAAATAFAAWDARSPADFLSAADRKMRGTRGAAVACAQWSQAETKLTFAGVGNIAASVRSGDSTKGRGLMSHNGTVGVEMRRLQAFDYECPAGSLLIMHSDGLQSRWSLDTYPGLLQRHPAVVAGVLYRDFCRGKDDLTVCVIRLGENA